MMKIQPLSLFFIILALLSGGHSFAQLLANDGVVNNVNGLPGGYVVSNGGQNYFSILTNDQLNGNFVYLSMVTITQISTSNAGVNLSGQNILLAAGTLPGNYTIQYQICQNNNLSNCDTATVTVNVCNVATPTVIGPDCSSESGTVTVSNLPATGTWTLYRRNFNSTVPLTGTGTSVTITGLTPGYYYFRVTNASGCTSTEVPVEVGYIDGLSVTTTGTYEDYNLDGITNVGDIITYHYAVTNLLTCPINNIQLEYAGPDSAFTFSGSPIASLAAGATDNSIVGTYVLSQNDINSGSVQAASYAALTATTMGGSELYLKVYPSNIALNVSDGLRLNVFVDTNNNGILDGNRTTFEYRAFYHTVECISAIPDLQPRWNGDVI